MLEEEPKPKQLGLGLRAKAKRATGEPLAPGLYAEREGVDYPEHGDDGGKWLIYVYWADLPGLWVIVQEAVEAGQLGQYAKVSNRPGNPGSGDSKAGVICVYTYDWRDEADCRRIRAALRTLGIERKISYKADADTKAGRYKTTGAKGLSKYFE